MKLYINLNNTFIVLFLMINIFFKCFSSNNHSYIYMSSIYINIPLYLLIYTTPYTSEYPTWVSSVHVIYITRYTPENLPGCHLYMYIYTTSYTLEQPTLYSPVYVHIHYTLYTRTPYLEVTNTLLIHVHLH